VQERDETKAFDLTLENDARLVRKGEHSAGHGAEGEKATDDADDEDNLEGVKFALLVFLIEETDEIEGRISIALGHVPEVFHVGLGSRKRSEFAEAIIALGFVDEEGINYFFSGMNKLVHLGEAGVEVGDVFFKVEEHVAHEREVFVADALFFAEKRDLIPEVAMDIEELFHLVFVVLEKDQIADEFGVVGRVANNGDELVAEVKLELGITDDLEDGVPKLVVGLVDFSRVVFGGGDDDGHDGFEICEDFGDWSSLGVEITKAVEEAIEHEMRDVVEVVFEIVDGFTEEDDAVFLIVEVVIAELGGNDIKRAVVVF